ncbi:DUF3540 domain-containing protein [uncultured Paraglaciecola sp.]|jgi:uncharacterized protein YchJ|uniref:DUF3540 domain-containing protein n=1 Tax=uncultured Paraglaciecola sp. TaxID=1765024 RepID=UPI00261BBDB5|nr:DUF3540 domain-containing protein [uncultured Paraglaciecola sp.]
MQNNAQSYVQNNVVSMHSPVASLLSGVVKKELAQLFIVQSDKGVLPAKQSASCLLVPEVDDKVLINMIDGDVYILAILEKASQRSKLSLKGDVTFESEGCLSMTSKKAMQITSLESISHLSPEVSALSKRHTITTETLSTNSQKLDVKSDQAQAHIKEVHGMFERVYQKADQVIRWVETIETLNIGNWVHNIKGTLNSRANNQVITAKSDVKVDAERIHMG